jgi:transposase
MVMTIASTDLRERLVAACDAGLRHAEAATIFGVSDRTVTRWHRLRRETGTVAPRPKPGRPPKIARPAYPALRAQVAAHADATLAEHCTWWERTHGIRVSPATMSRLLTKLDLPLKKRP